MGVQIYLAGAETPTLTKDLLAADIRHILYSYYYIRQGKKQEQFADLFANNPQRKFILDSGAFTYQVMWNNPEKRGRLPPVEKYWEEYLSFVRKYGHMCFGVAELDVDGLVTDTTLNDWREQLIEAVGDRAMPVWHPERGERAWKRLLADERLRYLGMASSTSDVGRMQRMVNEAHQRGKIVHGFAQTKINTVLKYVRFDTVDSTSWLSAQKFGQTFIFRHNKFIVLDKADMGGKNRRRLFKSYFEQIGCDWSLIDADEPKELRKASIIAWKNLSERMAKMRWADVIDKPIADREGAVITDTGSLVSIKERELDAHMSAKGKNRKFKIVLKKKEGAATEETKKVPAAEPKVSTKPKKLVSSKDGKGSLANKLGSVLLRRKSAATKTIEIECGDCHGTGQYSEPDGTPVGECWTCRGKGKLASTEVNSDETTEEILSPETEPGTEEEGIKRGAKVLMKPPTKAGWKTLLKPGEQTVDAVSEGNPSTPNSRPQNGPDEVFGSDENRGEDTKETHEGISETPTSTSRATDPEVQPEEQSPAQEGVRQRGLDRDTGTTAIVPAPTEDELARASGYDQKRAMELVKLGKVPQFMCSTCFIAQSCPEYKEGFICAFNKAFKAFEVRDVDHIELLMEHLVSRNKERTFRALLSEELVSGGQLDLNVSRQIQLTLQQLKEFRDLKQNVRKVAVTVEGSGPQQGGILSRLFGGGDQPKVVNPPKDQPVETSSITISTEIPVKPS